MPKSDLATEWATLDEVQRESVRQFIATRVVHVEQHVVWAQEKYGRVKVGGGRFSAGRVWWLIAHNAAPDANRLLRRTCSTEHCIEPTHNLYIAATQTQQLIEDDWLWARYVLERSTIEEDGHRIWTKSKQVGYGCARWHGERYYAHVLAWVVAHRQMVPDGNIVRHKCRRRDCCKPEHVEIGTKAENARDMERDGTFPNAKITRAIAEQIRATQDTATRRERAETYGLSVTNIGHIDNNRIWPCAGSNSGMQPSLFVMALILCCRQIG